MKRMKQVGIYIAGFITAIVILLSANSVWASSVLQAIYVSFDPIKIFIDGQERNPPEDMKPFIYEGRTYVSLRYVGEAFGKNVDWDGTTRSVIITETRNQMTHYSDSFDDPAKVGQYWIKSSGDTWKFDGPNGLNIESPGRLTLHDVLPDSYCNFTVEFETAKRGNNNGDLVNLNLGKNNNGDLGDFFVIGYDGARGTGLYYNSNNTPDKSNDAISRNTSLRSELDEFVIVKIQVKDRLASIYVNSEYITTQDVSMPKSAFAFNASSEHYMVTNSYNIRNFSIKID